MSRYEADDIYCIPGTAVLKNKAGITDQYLLDEYEGDFTAIRLLELAHNPIAGAFDLAHLSKTPSRLLFLRLTVICSTPTDVALKIRSHTSAVQAKHPTTVASTSNT